MEEARERGKAVQKEATMVLLRLISTRQENSDRGNGVEASELLCVSYCAGLAFSETQRLAFSKCGHCFTLALLYNTLPQAGSSHLL